MRNRSFVLLLLAACAAPPAEPVETHVAFVRDDLAGMEEVWCYGNIVIGANPSADAVWCGRRRGARVLVNLCDPGAKLSYDPAEVVADGIDYVAIPVDTVEVDDRAVDAVLAVLRERGDDGVVMHCCDGSRAAMMLAIHRAVDRGEPLEDAIADARQAGLKRSETAEAEIRRQVERLTRASD